MAEKKAMEEVQPLATEAFVGDDPWSTSPVEGSIGVGYIFIGIMENRMETTKVYWGCNFGCWGVRELLLQLASRCSRSNRLTCEVLNRIFPRNWINVRDPLCFFG